VDCDNRSAMPPSPHELLGVGELLLDVGRWPAGTIGTVVEADTERALVEISDDRGHGLDVISVPHHALAPAGDHATERFAS
jgi:hypothetical protein